MEIQKGTRCYECHKRITAPDNRTVQRKRRCTKCQRDRTLQKRRSDAERRLQQRFYNTARKIWPDSHSLWTLETVRQVTKRCNYESIISREGHPDVLCIVPVQVELRNHPPRPQDLVLVTKREGRELKRMRPEEREEYLNRYSDKIRSTRSTTTVTKADVDQK
jgi:hypothetical protein